MLLLSVADNAIIEVDDFGRLTDSLAIPMDLGSVEQLFPGYSAVCLSKTVNMTPAGTQALAMLGTLSGKSSVAQVQETLMGVARQFGHRVVTRHGIGAGLYVTSRNQISGELSGRSLQIVHISFAGNWAEAQRGLVRFESNRFTWTASKAELLSAIGGLLTKGSLVPLLQIH